MDNTTHWYILGGKIQNTIVIDSIIEDAIMIMNQSIGTKMARLMMGQQTYTFQKLVIKQKFIR